MAGNKTLKLTVQIAGKIDKSLASALGRASGQISGLSKTISKIGTIGLATVATTATASIAAIKKCTNEAIKYQDELGDVIKYVDGLADSTGRITNEVARNLNGEALNGKTYAENYELVYDSIQRISTQVPLTREYIAEMTAAIGQSGKSIEQMFTFDENGNIGGLVKDAAVMAAAWDIEAKEAAEYAAKWENALGLSHEEVMILADQINYLGANSATTAAEIAKAVNQAASLGQLAGIDPSTAAALADAMLATGVASDRVGTSIKRMALNLSKGEDMSKKQKAVLDELGMSAEGVSKAMVEDSIGTLHALFEGIGELPEERRLNAVGQLFGIWAAEGGAKIVNNLEVYEEALRLVNEQREMLTSGVPISSMDREFAIKTSTPEAIRQMRDNAAAMLKVGIGRSFVPLQAKVDQSLTNLFLRLADNEPQLKELAGTLAELAAKGIDRIADALEKALPYIERFLDYLNNNGEEAAKTAGKIAGAFALMKFAPMIEGTARLGGGLLGGLAKTPGAIGEGIFGHRLKNGTRRGGLLNGAGSYLGSVWNATRRTNFGAGLSAIGSAIGGAGKTAWTMAGGPGVLAGAKGIAGSIAGGPIGNAARLGSAVWSPILSGFGGMVAGAAPAVLGVSGIIAVLSILGDHLEEIRELVGDVFGEKGLQVFDAFQGKMETVKTFMDNLFGEGGAAKLLEPLRQGFMNIFGENSGAAFDGIVAIFQSVLNVAKMVVDFATTTLKPIIENAFSFITGTVMPKLIEMFGAIAPVAATMIESIGGAVMNVFKLVGYIYKTIQPVVEGVVNVIMAIGSVAIPAAMEGMTYLFNEISAIIENLKAAFDGIVQFISGVFKGDWEQAWEGVKSVFGTVFATLGELFKAPINTVITLINGVIDRVNGMGVDIPSWARGAFGGQERLSFSMKKLELLAKGGFTNGPSIAGEAGTEAVISFQRSQRSQNLAIWKRAGQLLGAGEHELRQIGSGGGGNGGQIVFSPQITINGNADREEVAAGIRDAYEEFRHFMGRYQREQKRYGFAAP